MIACLESSSWQSDFKKKLKEEVIKMEVIMKTQEYAASCEMEFDSFVAALDKDIEWPETEEMFRKFVFESIKKAAVEAHEEAQRKLKKQKERFLDNLKHYREDALLSKTVEEAAETQLAKHSGWTEAPEAEREAWFLEYVQKEGPRSFIDLLKNYDVQSSMEWADAMPLLQDDRLYEVLEAQQRQQLFSAYIAKLKKKEEETGDEKKAKKAKKEKKEKKQKKDKKRSRSRSRDRDSKRHDSAKKDKRKKDGESDSDDDRKRKKTRDDSDTE